MVGPVIRRARRRSRSSWTMPARSGSPLRLLPAAALVAVGLVALVFQRGGRHESAHAGRRGATRQTRRPHPPRSRALTTHLVARLPAPVQLPATAALPDGRAILAGGLSQADTSVSAVTVAGPNGARSAGRLPEPLHDAAAATIGGRSYFFGGGEPSHDGILELVPGGTARHVGSLRAPASDVAAATIGGQIYVVGGFTGTVPLDTIQEWRPGKARARVVARLPAPLRYAAVTAANGALFVVGGTGGTKASSAVYRFDPMTRRVARVATLPRPLTHAAAAAIGGTVYVIGGRGSTLGTQVRSILAVDAATGKVTSAGRLPRALSDMGASGTRSGILIAGGRERSGNVSDVLLLLRRR
jgi:hypothetical protein